MPGRGAAWAEELTPLDRWTLACRALPTRGQALTETPWSLTSRRRWCGMA
ncbi:MAG: hypothetical protein WDN49_09250 [Acetobacteraceae bacterium]